ncbi:MAG TPA: hypothetical protein VHM24_00115 [Gemmatimonadaceae bacterium]|nr:hypothetical protein [Gemmatimonadaceae bacterium]
MRLARLATFLVAFAVGACVHASASSQSDQDNALITEDEIVASHAATAYDAVKLLRGNFLTSRGKTTLLRDSTSSSLPTVYLDDQEFGPLLTLKSIPASHVVAIRLYRSWEATTKFGAGNMGGVISVVTRH